MTSTHNSLAAAAPSSFSLQFSMVFLADWRQEPSHSIHRFVPSATFSYRRKGILAYGNLLPPPKKGHAFPQQSSPSIHSTKKGLHPILVHLAIHFIVLHPFLPSIPKQFFGHFLLFA
jgi:hypothetical protein